MLKSTEIIEDVDDKQYQRQKEEGGLPPVCEFAFQMVGNQGEQDVFEQEGAFAAPIPKPRLRDIAAQAVSAFDTVFVVRM
ncbi:MAG: hypothetical protein ACFNKE_05485, partial [Neisseria elongata]